jgi:hypothetical protein
VPEDTRPFWLKKVDNMKIFGSDRTFVLNLSTYSWDLTPDGVLLDLGLNGHHQVGLEALDPGQPVPTSRLAQILARVILSADMALEVGLVVEHSWRVKSWVYTPYTPYRNSNSPSGRGSDMLAKAKVVAAEEVAKHLAAGRPVPGRLDGEPVVIVPNQPKPSRVPEAARPIPGPGKSYGKEPLGTWVVLLGILTILWVLYTVQVSVGAVKDRYDKEILKLKAQHAAQALVHEKAEHSACVTQLSALRATPKPCGSGPSFCFGETDKAKMLVWLDNYQTCVDTLKEANFMVRDMRVNLEAH